MQRIFQNKKITREFDLLDTLEVGIVLKGWEVKSAKNSRIDVNGAYVEYDSNGELFLKGARIAPWKTGERISPDEQKRARKLLAKKSQAEKIGGMASRPGYTLIPLEGYVNDKGLIKISIALVKGRKKYQTRQKLKERDMARQLRKDLKKY